MGSNQYILKISPQGQVTLPRGLRERLHVSPGSRITVDVREDGNLRISGEPPIAAYFGKLRGTWLDNEQDAADYARHLRNDMQHKQ